MVEILDIDRAELVRMGAGVFPALERGTIIFVRRVDEINQLTDHIVATLAARHSAALADEARTLFESGQTPGYETLVALLLALRELRDSRYMSCLFADLVAGFGLPAPILIDTGYFRTIFQKDFPALRADKRLPRNLYEATPKETAEPFLYGANLGGGPHRDVDTVHYTFQMNFWFPLHDVTAENSLLLFPEIYTTNVPYQQKPERLGEPDHWGYGKALRRALRRGDLVLFHSQHFHASPSEAPENDRLTAELRVASACIDDNAMIYRQLFWRAENFAPMSPVVVPPATRAARLFPHRAGGNTDTVLTAHEAVATLFDRAEDARYAGGLWTLESVFAPAHKLSDTALGDLIARLRAAPFAEDRQLMLARYLLWIGRADLAEPVFTDMVARTGSYFFALEAARLASAVRLWVPTGQALLKAVALAQSSPVAIGRYRGDIPAREGVPRLQLMPEDVRHFVPTMIGILRDYLASPSTLPVPLLDHRLCFPLLVSGHTMGGFPGAIVKVLMLLIYIPQHRIAEIGLKLVTSNGSTRYDGEFMVERIMRDPTGVIVAYSAAELETKLRHATAVRA